MVLEVKFWARWLWFRFLHVAVRCQLWLQSLKARLDCASHDWQSKLADGWEWKVHMSEAIQRVVPWFLKEAFHVWVFSLSFTKGRKRKLSGLLMAKSRISTASLLSCCVCERGHSAPIFLGVEKWVLPLDGTVARDGR